MHRPTVAAVELAARTRQRIGDTPPCCELRRSLELFLVLDRDRLELALHGASLGPDVGDAVVDGRGRAVRRPTSTATTRPTIEGCAEGERDARRRRRPAGHVDRHAQLLPMTTAGRWTPRSTSGRPRRRRRPLESSARRGAEETQSDGGTRTGPTVAVMPRETALDAHRSSCAPTPHELTGRVDDGSPKRSKTSTRVGRWSVACDPRRDDRERAPAPCPATGALTASSSRAGTIRSRFDAEAERATGRARSALRSATYSTSTFGAMPGRRRHRRLPSHPSRRARPTRRSASACPRVVWNKRHGVADR